MFKEMDKILFKNVLTSPQRKVLHTSYRQQERIELKIQNSYYQIQFVQASLSGGI